MSDRMAKGDAHQRLQPLNSQCLSLHRRGEIRQWVKDYVGTWERFTEENGARPIMLLSGKIGEYTGYCGADTTVGFGLEEERMCVCDPDFREVATLMTGDKRYSDLPRARWLSCGKREA